LAQPSVTVEVALDGGPFSTSYTWTDITNWVQALKVKRGRSYELDRIEAGTLSLTLDNADGRFTPGRDTINELLPDNVRTGTETLGSTSGFSAGTGVTLASGTSTPHSGTKALQILGSSLSAFQWIAYPNTVNVTAGTAYQGSMWIRKTVSGGYADVPLQVVLAWYDASFALLSESPGATWDGTSSSYTKLSATGTAPANAAHCFFVLKSTAAVASSYVYWADDWSLAQVNPNYPNIIPRRRIRVRTPNLLPKDTATGGDITRTSAAYNCVTAGTSDFYTTSVAKSGSGAIQVQFGNNGTAEFASAVQVGYVATVPAGQWWWSGTTKVPTGLARIAPGSHYSAAAQVQLKTGSPATGVKARLKYYDAAGNFLASSAASGTINLVAGSWVTVSILNQTAPANAVWAGVEIGNNLNGDNSAVIYVDEAQLELGTTVSAWTPGGSVFSGYVEKWSVQLDSLVPTCEVSAVDGFSVLGTTEMRTPYQSAVLASEPVGYWPLTDSVGSTTVANLVDDTQAGALVASKYGGATPAFGAASLLSKEPTPTAYSLGNISSTTGTVIDVNDSGKRNYPLAFELSVAFWALPVRPSSGNVITLWSCWDDMAQNLLSIRLDSAGVVTVLVTYAAGETQTYDTTSILTLSTSTPSFIAVTIAGGSFTLYVNGALAFGYPNSPASNTDLRDLRWSSLAGRQAGSIYSEYANGRYGHLAVWDRALLGSEVSDLWKLGGNGTTAYTEAEDLRLSRLAAYANFQGDLSLDGGKSTLQTPTWDDATAALEVLQNAAEDAAGYVFIDSDGRLTYHNRARRQSAPVRYTLGDSTGLPYEPGLTFTMDDDKVINEVTYTRTGGAAATVRSASSIATYGRKSKSLDLAITTDSAAKDAAYSLLNAYEVPIVRCDQVSINATATNALFPIALGIEIGDRVRLADLPPGAPASSYEFYVEAIDTDVSVDGQTARWVATLSLSPATATDVWVIEDGTNGILDSTTILAY
jgi:hypothetical protein